MYQVWIKKTNISESPFKCRKERNDIKTGWTNKPRISLTETCLLVRRYPAQRWRELDPGSNVELRETVVAMSKRKAQAEDLRGRSIEALHRDGQTCSSEEADVMAVERRGLVTHTQLIANWK
jgi:hypothetical protein